MNVDKYVIEHGDVWLVGSSRTSGVKSHVCRGSERLAVAYVDDQLLKIGREDLVTDWVSKNRHKVIGDGDVITIGLPVAQSIVDELNRLREYSGSVVHFVDRLAKLAVAEPGLAEIPSYRYEKPVQIY